MSRRTVRHCGRVDSTYPDAFQALTPWSASFEHADVSPSPIGLIAPFRDQRLERFVPKDLALCSFTRQPGSGRAKIAF
jgi:hypothetical protein